MGKKQNKREQAAPAEVEQAKPSAKTEVQDKKGGKGGKGKK